MCWSKGRSCRTLTNQVDSETSHLSQEKQSEHLMQLHLSSIICCGKETRSEDRKRTILGQTVNNKRPKTGPRRKTKEWTAVFPAEFCLHFNLPTATLGSLGQNIMSEMWSRTSGKTLWISARNHIRILHEYTSFSRGSGFSVEPHYAAFRAQTISPAVRDPHDSSRPSAASTSIYCRLSF